MSARCAEARHFLGQTKHLCAKRKALLVLGGRRGGRSGRMRRGSRAISETCSEARSTVDASFEFEQRAARVPPPHPALRATFSSAGGEGLSLCLRSRARR